MTFAINYNKNLNDFTLADHTVGLAFRQTAKGDLFSAVWTAAYTETAHDLARRLQGAIGRIADLSEPRIEMVTHSLLSLTVPGRFLLLVRLGSANAGPFWEAHGGEGEVYACGTAEACREIYERHLRPGRAPNQGKVTWTFEVQGKQEEITVDLEDPGPLHPEFYPYLDRSPEELIDDYLSDPASVLLLQGPPGTGKTTLIRRIICKSNGRALYSFDKGALESDQIFVKFLTSYKDLLVVEDADAFIGLREHGNQVMAKFLNASDGLIKMKDKKVIVSTNIAEEAQIDPALLRPGRCFAAPRFELLTPAQALRAAEVAGVPRPDPDSGPMTLAEVFALGSTGRKRGVARDGFGFSLRR